MDLHKLTTEELRGYDAAKLRETENDLRKQLVNVPQLENVSWCTLLEILCKDNGLRLDDSRIKEKVVVVWRPKRVSLNFKDAELRDVVWSIARQAELNVVIDPEVQGSVTASMTDVAWDVALTTILKANGYVAVSDHGSLRIGK